MKTNFRAKIGNTFVYGNRRKTKKGGRIIIARLPEQKTNITPDKIDPKHVIAALVKNSDGFHLVNCAIHNDKPYYQYSLSATNEKRFSLDDISYSQKQEKIKRLCVSFLDI